MQTDFSISSSKPSKGVRSNTMSPGEPGDGGLRLLGTMGIENTFSDAHSPESGTSNLCSSQIAVPSFSAFVDSQTRHCVG